MIVPQRPRPGRDRPASRGAARDGDDRAGRALEPSSATRPNSTPSTHRPSRQYALRRTPSRTKPTRSKSQRAVVERVDLELEPVEAAAVDQLGDEQLQRASRARRCPGATGATARPPRLAMRERRLTRSNSTVPPARRRPRSRTTPNASGSSAHRSTRRDRPVVARAHGGEERRDLGVTRARRGSRRPPARRRRIATVTARRPVARGAGASAPEPSATPSEDQREAAERGSGDRLVEEQRAVDEREARASGR